MIYNAPNWINGTSPAMNATEMNLISSALAQDGLEILALQTKVPDPPTTDGTYVLTATVSGGTATYAWVSQ